MLSNTTMHNEIAAPFKDEIERKTPGLKHDFQEAFGRF